MIHPPGWDPNSNELAASRSFAERHPGLKLIIDHLGRPSGSKDDAGFANLPELLALAKYPNVAIKATGAPSYSSEPYPYHNIHGYLRQIYDAFGPERMFWGTDITRMPCSWRQCVTMFTEGLSWLSARDKELTWDAPSARGSTGSYLDERVEGHGIRISFPVDCRDSR